jgi:FMN phosphatase YigB (HAD superfamily)
MKTCGVSESRVASFDVFGTLLFRRISEPGRRLALLAGQGEAAVQWSRRRIEAEHALAHSKGADLYSLDEIYTQLGSSSPTPQDEMDLEERLCFPVTKGRRLLTSARQRGQQVIFVSDMYLPGEFIRQLLEKHGLWLAGDRLYVSHEHGMAKHGGLFGKICEELSLTPDQVQHIGDNLRSDVLAPRRLGIRTAHFRATEFTRYEQEWARNGGEGVADAIRATRLQFSEELDDRGQAVWETACGVAGPLFISYVLWLEQQAKELGIQRLYFISRDGLIFKKIFDSIFMGRLNSPESRYLHGSRQAWSGVRVARLTDEDIEWLTKPGTSVTLAKFAQRCDLAVHEMAALPWAKRPEKDESLSGSSLAELRLFLRSGLLRDRLQAAGRESCSRASAYLRQEGLGMGRYGLVDLGWFGNLQEYVQELVPENVPIMGFYLDLRSRPRIQQEGRARAYIGFPLLRGIDQANSITLLEILAGSQEGSVMGYREEKGVWKSVRNVRDDEQGPEHWADLQHHAIIALAGEILLQPGGIQSIVPSNEVNWKNFCQFLKHPSFSEAEAYGDISFVSNQEGGGGIILAPRVSLSEGWGFFQRGFWKRQISWPPGMIARSNGITRWVLKTRYMLSQSVEILRSLARSREQFGDVTLRPVRVR